MKVMAPRSSNAGSERQASCRVEKLDGANVTRPSHAVAIVGAGPAGSTLALRLARAGFSVALVEKQRFPRFKPCGEFMSPQVLPLLAELGVDDEIRRAGARAVRGMLLHAHGVQTRGSFVDVGDAIAPCDHGWAIRRDVFDDLLLRAALRTGGVELFEGFEPTRLLRDDAGGIRGIAIAKRDGEQREITASFTIGADGVRSRIAAELGVQRETGWLDKLALTTRYAGVAWTDCAEVHFVGHGVEHGFIACAPVDAGLVSVNVVIERDAFARSALPRDQAFEHWLALAPSLAERLGRGRRIDPIRGTSRFATSTTAQTFDGAALVGDACGYVDPVTGEGIFFALKGAEMLASALVDALHAGRRDRASLSAYLAGRRRELVPRAAFATLLQRGLKHPRLVRAAFRLLEARPRLTDVLVSLTGDYVPLRELTRPSLWLSALARS